MTASRPRWLARWLGRATPRPAAALYAALVEAARNPVLFRKLGAADTVDGRFDMILLVLAPVLTRLDALGPDADALRVALIERFADDMNRSIRELGVGDLSVDKHLRRMADALEGRRQAYAVTGGQGLRDALVRNLYRGETPESTCLDSACACLEGWRSRLSTWPLERIAALDAAPDLLDLP